MDEGDPEIKDEAHEGDISKKINESRQKYIEDLQAKIDEKEKSENNEKNEKKKTVDDILEGDSGLKGQREEARKLEHEKHEIEKEENLSKPITSVDDIEGVGDLLRYISHLFGLDEGLNEDEKTEKEKKRKELEGFLAEMESGKEPLSDKAERIKNFIGAEKKEVLAENIKALKGRISDKQKSKNELEALAKTFDRFGQEKIFTRNDSSPVRWVDLAYVSAELYKCGEITDDKERDEKVNMLIRNNKGAYDALVYVDQKELSIYRYMYATGGSISYSDAEFHYDRNKQEQGRFSDRERGIGDIERIQKGIKKIENDRLEIEGARDLGIDVNGNGEAGDWEAKLISDSKGFFGGQGKSEEMTNLMAVIRMVETEYVDKLKAFKREAGFDDKLTVDEMNNMYMKAYNDARTYVLFGRDAAKKGGIVGEKEGMSEADLEQMDASFGKVFGDISEDGLKRYHELLEENSFFDKKEKERQLNMEKYKKLSADLEKQKAKVIMLRSDISSNDGKNIHENLKSSGLTGKIYKELKDSGLEEKDVKKINKRLKNINEKLVAAKKAGDTKKIGTLEAEKKTWLGHMNAITEQVKDKIRVVSQCREHLDKSSDPINTRATGSYSEGVKEFGSGDDIIRKKTGAKTESSHMLTSLRNSNNRMRDENHKYELCKAARDAVLYSKGLDPSIIGLKLADENGKEFESSEVIVEEAKVRLGKAKKERAEQKEGSDLAMQIQDLERMAKADPEGAKRYGKDIGDYKEKFDKFTEEKKEKEQNLSNHRTVRDFPGVLEKSRAAVAEFIPLAKARAAIETANANMVDALEVFKKMAMGDNNGNYIKDEKFPESLAKFYEETFLKEGVTGNRLDLTTYSNFANNTDFANNITAGKNHLKWAKFFNEYRSEYPKETENAAWVKHIADNFKKVEENSKQYIELAGKDLGVDKGLVGVDTKDILNVKVEDDKVSFVISEKGKEKTIEVNDEKIKAKFDEKIEEVKENTKEVYRILGENEGGRDDKANDIINGDDDYTKAQTLSDNIGAKATGFTGDIVKKTETKVLEERNRTIFWANLKTEEEVENERKGITKEEEALKKEAKRITKDKDKIFAEKEDGKIVLTEIMQKQMESNEKSGDKTAEHKTAPALYAAFSKLGQATESSGAAGLAEKEKEKDYFQKSEKERKEKAVEAGVAGKKNIK